MSGEPWTWALASVVFLAFVLALTIGVLVVGKGNHQRDEAWRRLERQRKALRCRRRRQV